MQQSSGKAEGMYVSVAGLPNEQLPAAGKVFVKSFSRSIGGAEPDPYAVYAAQAAQVFVNAISKSDGTPRRAWPTSCSRSGSASGILGPIAFNRNGDVTANPVTIYLVKGGKSTTYQVIVPAPSLVAAA